MHFTENMAGAATTMRSIAARTAALSAVVPLCIASPAFAAERWDWMVVPYGWAASIDTDLETRLPPSAAGADTSFADIVDKIDGAFQIHVEGQGDRFGSFADFTYLGLGDHKDFPRVASETDLDMRLFELAAIWSPGQGRLTGMEAFAGLRYIDVDLTLRLDPMNALFDGATVDGSGSFSDFMIGARYTWAFSERWRLTLRGDGSFGDTEGTWNASAVAQYRTRNGAWLFGYRHLDVEIQTRTATTGITMSGVEVGYGFRF